jgi:hypothetical protein
MATVEAGEMFMHPSRALPYGGEYGWSRCISRGVYQYATLRLDVDSDAATVALRLPAYREPDDLLAVVDAPAGFLR